MDWWVRRKMEGWAGGRTDGRTDGWTDGQRDGRTDRRMDTDAWMHGRTRGTLRRMHAMTGRQAVGWVDALGCGRADRLAGWLGGCIDAQTHRHADG